MVIRHRQIPAGWQPDNPRVACNRVTRKAAVYGSRRQWIGRVVHYATDARGDERIAGASRHRDMRGNSQTPTFRAIGYRLARNSDKMPAPAGGLPISFWDELGCGRGGIEKVFTSSRVGRTMEQQMGRRILCWSTIALLAVGSCGNNSFAGPLEDGLAVPVEDDACTKEVVPLRKDAEERGELIRAASARRAPPNEACK